jgi:hypothetical protein
MFRYAGLVYVTGALAIAALAQSVPKDLLSSPAHLQLDRPTAEIKAGSSINYTVTLRSEQNQPVAADQDLMLQVDTPSGPQNLLLRKGQSSTSFTWKATTAGVAHIVVRSGKLHPASGLVLVAPQPISKVMLPLEIAAPVAGALHAPPIAVAKPNLGAHAAIEKHAIVGHLAMPAAQPAAAQPTPVPPPPAPVTPQPTKLQLYVNPEPVLGNALNHSWKATVAIAALGAEDQFIPVTNPVQVHFTTSFGQVTPADVTLNPGDLSTFQSPAVLTSTHIGTDSLQALSSLGTAGPVSVIYLQPPPTQIVLYVTTPQLAGSGSSAGVTVCLADEAGAPATSAQDSQVELSTQTGQLSKSLVTIPQNSICSEQITWSSSKSGIAVVSANSSLGSASKPANFPPFPWYLIWLAALGGVVGALVINSTGLFSASWWSHTWRSLIIGAVLGAIIYLLARFGALEKTADLGVQIQNIPFLSGAGSFVIGFLGGAIGRKILKLDGDKDEEKSQPPEPPAAKGAAGGP